MTIIYVKMLKKISQIPELRVELLLLLLGITLPQPVIIWPVIGVVVDNSVKLEFVIAKI